MIATGAKLDENPEHRRGQVARLARVLHARATVPSASVIERLGIGALYCVALALAAPGLWALWASS